MKNKIVLAVLTFSLVLTMSGCEAEGWKNIMPSGEKKEADQTASQVEVNTDEGQEPTGFGTRLVSVSDIEKYVDIAEYKGLTLEKTIPEITDEQIDAQIKWSLEGEKTEVTDSSASVQKGDLVTISYVSTVNGSVQETEENYDLTVGEGSMIEGFEDGLVGMKKGETRTLNLTYPEAFYSKELSGAAVTYKVTLQSFMRAPVIDDAWVAANTEVTTLDEYRQLVRAQMEQSLETEAQESLRYMAWDIVLTNSEVLEYPKADLQNAIDEYKKQAMEYNDSDMTLEEYVKSQGMSLEEFEDQCLQYAESKVKQNLIVQGILDAEGISMSDPECLAILDQLVVNFGVSSLAQLLDAYGQTMIDEAIGLIRVEDLIVENAVVEERSGNAALPGIEVGQNTGTVTGNAGEDLTGASGVEEGKTDAAMEAAVMTENTETAQEMVSEDQISSDESMGE